MSRPLSVTAGAGLAGLTAALTALLWTGTDFASTSATPPPPPSPPAGVSAEEWERVLATPSSVPEQPLTNLDVFSFVFESFLVVLAVTGVVVWLVVAIAAVRGHGWARFVAAAAVAGQGSMILVLGAGSAGAPYAVGVAVVVAGAASAALLLRSDAVAHFNAGAPRPRTVAAPVPAPGG